MVGVPRSKGCSLCVKRRIKCDQVRPACGNCIKYGVDCPGYEKIHKFVTGKHLIRARNSQEQSQRQRQHRQGLLTWPAAQTSWSSSPAPTTAVSNLEIQNTTSALAASGSLDGQPWHLQPHRHQDPFYPVKLVAPVLLREDPVPLVYGLLRELFTAQKRDEVVFSAPWFTSMLPHIGRVSLLDAAMASLLLQLVGKAKRGNLELCKSRELYSSVLASLQRALNHPVLWKSAETLAATIICCIFELFAGTNNALTWMVHATGIGKLVQQRGHAAFSNNSFDVSLLRGVRPIVITKAIFAGHECFLDRPKWRKVSETLTSNSSDKPFLPAIPMTDALQWTPLHHQDRFFVLHAKMARVTQMGYRLRRERKRGVEPESEQINELRSMAEHLRTSFVTWHTRARETGAFPDPFEVPSADPTSPFPTVLNFGDPWDGSLILAYWANLLILQECINDCCDAGTSKPFEAANLRLAHDILRGMVQVGAGFMGPYRVGYPLRVAIDFVDEDTQGWVLKMVDKYNEHYAAMSSKVYPQNPLIRETDAEYVDDDAAEAMMPSSSVP